MYLWILLKVFTNWLDAVAKTVIYSVMLYVWGTPDILLDGIELS